MGQTEWPAGNLHNPMKKPVKRKAPPVPDWPAIRARYEGRGEAVADIAAAFGLGVMELSSQAKARGWRMRSAKARRAAAKAPVPEAAAGAPRRQPAPSTQVVIRRLKALVQARISRLEEEMKPQGREGGALDAERGIRATNTLARTLEKVLDLEHRDRKQRKLKSRAAADDAGREELARRIAALASEGEGQGGEPGPQPAADPNLAERVAPVGAAGSAAAPA